MDQEIRFLVKKKKKAGIHGPDGLRGKKKSRYPQPRWANLEEKEEKEEGKNKTN